MALLGDWRSQQNTEAYSNSLYSESLEQFLGREVQVLDEDCSPVYASVLEVEGDIPDISRINSWIEGIRSIQGVGPRLEWFSQQEALMSSEIQVFSNNQIRDYLSKTYLLEISTQDLASSALDRATSGVYALVRDRELGNYSGPLLDSGWASAMGRDIRNACEPKAKEMAEEAGQRHLISLAELGTAIIELRNGNWPPSGFTQVSMYMAHSFESEGEFCSISNPNGCAIFTVVTPIKCSLEVEVKFSNPFGGETSKARVTTVANRPTEIEIGQKSDRESTGFSVVAGICS